MTDPPADEHRDIRECLGVYVLGRATPEECALVAAHVDVCASCRDELVDLTALVPRLAALTGERGRSHRFPW